MLTRDLRDDNVIDFARSHPVDWLFGRFVRRSRLFLDGWGDEAALTAITESEAFRPSPVQLEIAWGHREVARGIVRTEGRFTSPVAALPESVRIAHVRRLSRAATQGRAACLVLAGSREEGFSLREGVYGPLAAEGIDLVLLENPYYGLRRPPGQNGANLRTVADHAWMNLAIVAEAHALLAALRAEGYERIGVTGYSMGGYMAALAAGFTDAPLAVAALAAGDSPAPVFTRGLLSRSIDFASLGGSTARPRERLAALFDSARATRWPAPAHPESAIIVACRRDGYVPKSESVALHAHWPKSELRWIDAGHISALFTERPALRAAVRDAFARLPSKKTRDAQGDDHGPIPQSR